MLSTLEIELTPAPLTSLNLQMGVAYAPRVESPFAAYAVAEVEPGVFEVFGYAAAGGAVVFRGALGPAWFRLAECLGMQ